MSALREQRPSRPRASRILAIPGSLRAASINHAFCRAAARLAHDGIAVEVFEGLGALPLFNPDLESAPPARVTDLRAAVARADALLIASPEYAHGIAGPLTNALDWLVSFEGFVAKRAGVVNLAPRAHHAHTALLEVLATMSAIIVPAACVTLALPRGVVDEAGIGGDADVAASIRGLLSALATEG